MLVISMLGIVNNFNLLYLNEATKGSLGAFGCMCAKPWCVPPHGFAIAACNHLVVTNHQFKRPHTRLHLPKHKATIFTASCTQALDILPR